MGVWTGTKAGCLCDVGFFENRCDDTPNCKDINPVSPARYHFWGRDSFCIKRASQFIETKDNCQSGMKRCENTKYCVHNEELCPITHMMLVHDNDKTPDGYRELDLTHHEKLVFTNKDYTHRPIIDI